MLNIVCRLRSIARVAVFLAVAAAVFGIWAYAGQAPMETEQARKTSTGALQVTRPVQVEVQSSMPDFFAEFRLERDRLRSERSDLLREMTKAGKSDEARLRAQEHLLKLLADRQREAEMENLIKTRGFTDAIVFLREGSVSAVLRSATLSREEVARVADIISRVSGVRPEDITVSARP